MRPTRSAFGPLTLAAAVALFGASAQAQRGPGGMHGGGPRGPVSTPHGGPHGGPQIGGPKGPGGGAPRSGPGSGPRTDGPKGGGRGHSPHGPDSRVPAGTAGTPTTSPIADRIEQHPQLATRLQALLPAGMTLDQAASGFKNQGQFIAALHVSRNLGIAFSDLKTQMVTNGQSLGQSIQTLRPATNGPTEARVAESQAQRDLDDEGPRVRVPDPPEPRDLGNH